MNYKCDCVSDFQMKAVSKEKCAETLMTVGLMQAETANSANKVIQLLSDLEAEIQAECVETKRLQKPTCAMDRCSCVNEMMPK